MQRSDLEAEVSRLLGDANNTRWSTSVIDSRLDAAVIDVQKYARAVKTTASYTPTANLATVTVNSGIIDILRASYTLADGTIKGPNRGFNPINRYQLDIQYPNWQNEDPGEPTRWTLDASNAQIILIPTPTAADVSANCLTLLEVRQPTNTLSAGSASTVPFDANALMVPFHRAIIYWAVAECYRDNNDTESLNKAKYFRSDNRQAPGLYETELRQIMSLFDCPEAVPAIVTYRPQGGRLGSPGQLSKSNPLGFS